MTKAQLFAEYGSYHGDSRNRICHFIGIPLIVLSLLGLASLVVLGPVNLALPLALAVLAYYAVLDIRGALVSAVIFLALYFVAVHLTLWLDVALFVIGWVFQLVGHRFEGNKPKFLTNLVYLLVGPLYIFDELLLMAGASKRAT